MFIVDSLCCLLGVAGEIQRSHDDTGFWKLLGAVFIALRYATRAIRILPGVCVCGGGWWVGVFVCDVL